MYFDCNDCLFDRFTCDITGRCFMEEDYMGRDSVAANEPCDLVEEGKQTNEQL